jgi:hypothetical protein
MRKVLTISDVFVEVKIWKISIKTKKFCCPYEEKWKQQ